jgi:hypothetical protein
VSNEKETCEHPRQWIIPNTVAGNSGWCFECGSINLTGEWKQPDAILRLKDEARGAQQLREQLKAMTHQRDHAWAEHRTVLLWSESRGEAQRLRKALEKIRDGNHAHGDASFVARAALEASKDEQP